jgi:hypothetical protein
MDFLGTGTSSNNNQSNSYVLRQRQIWGKAELAKAALRDRRPDVVAGHRRPQGHRHTHRDPAADHRFAVPGRLQLGASAGLPYPAALRRLQDRRLHAALSVEQAQITSFTANGTVPTDYFFGGLGQNGGLVQRGG